MTNIPGILSRCVAVLSRSTGRRVASRVAAAVMLSSLCSPLATAQYAANPISPMSTTPMSWDGSLYRAQSPEASPYVIQAAGGSLSDEENLIGADGPTRIDQMPSTLVPQGRMTSANHQAVPFAPMQLQNVDNGYEVPCPCDDGCDFTYYGSAEALYFRREHDERFTLSRNARIEPFDYEWAGRVTFGQLTDCVNGYEFSYAGPFKWTRHSAVAGPGTLQSKLIPSGGYTATEVDRFNNADLHVQDYQSRLSSYEFNRRRWSWDVLSVLFGLRVLDMRENYAFQSIQGATTGLMVNSTRNIMFGPQIGGDIRTPIGLRGLVGLKGKAGVLANLNRGQSFLRNNGVNVIDSQDNDIDVAGIFEFGTFGVYSVTRSVRLTAGYEFWYIPGVATIPGQSPNRISPETGVKVYANDEMLVHGGSAGVEILY
ncbi:MAG: hypothetical protein U0892_07345 [Pirellulales bacterium]